MEKIPYKLILRILGVGSEDYCVIYLINFFFNFLVALSKKFPNNLSFGMEIRDKLVNYIGEKILALRHNEPGHY